MSQDIHHTKELQEICDLLVSKFPQAFYVSVDVPQDNRVPAQKVVHSLLQLRQAI